MFALSGRVTAWGRIIHHEVSKTFAQHVVAAGSERHKRDRRTTAIAGVATLPSASTVAAPMASTLSTASS